MLIRPLNDRVLVKRIQDSKKRVSGIIIPDTAKEKSQEGEVIATGPGKRLETGEYTPIAVSAGDRILFGKYAGTEVKIENQGYLLMREDDILAKIA